MSAVLPDDLPALVKAKYKSAQSEGALVFTETQQATVDVAGASYHIRYSPSLSKKPAPQSHPPSAQKKTDPFISSSLSLFVTDIASSSSAASDGDPSHIIILNKYPIIPCHFILATYKDKPQTHPLEQDDVYVTYCLLQAWKRSSTRNDNDGRRMSLFAFFNSGLESGASQPHRHVQFLPVNGVRPEVDETWQPLIQEFAASMNESKQGEDELGILDLHDSRLPLRAFVARLTPSITPERLHEIYIRMLELACKAADHSTDLPVVIAGKDTPFAYNMAMTEEVMVVLPRTAAESVIKGEKGEVVEGVGVNGTVLAGTLLCKTHEAFVILSAEGGGEMLVGVLKGIGIPNDGPVGESRERL